MLGVLQGGVRSQSVVDDRRLGGARFTATAALLRSMPSVDSANEQRLAWIASFSRVRVRSALRRLSHRGTSNTAKSASSRAKKSLRRPKGTKTQTAPVAVQARSGFSAKRHAQRSLQHRRCVGPLRGKQLSSNQYRSEPAMPAAPLAGCCSGP